MSDNIETLKICKRCKQTLSMSMFHNYKNSLDGKSIYCKSCTSYIQKKNREKRELEKYKIKKEQEALKQQESQQDTVLKKTCFRCKVEKDLTGFHREQKQKDGYSCVCIECKKKREAENILKRLEKRGY